MDRTLSWVPKIGPFSSIDDRARELFYDLIDTTEIRYSKSHSKFHECTKPKQNYKINLSIYTLRKKMGMGTVKRMVKIMMVMFLLGILREG